MKSEFTSVRRGLGDSAFVPRRTFSGCRNDVEKPACSSDQAEGLVMVCCLFWSMQQMSLLQLGKGGVEVKHCCPESHGHTGAASMLGFRIQTAVSCSPESMAKDHHLYETERHF